ncbi:MAG: hypothetical protein KDD60_12960 [Bdellovibrionales bacterium]|nr:hypothetical protein [Bdellovibrionales bacterium]
MNEENMEQETGEQQVQDRSADCLSQESYSETPYVDSSWEIIGDAPNVTQFVPMEVPVLPHDRAFFDPMFADYGGVAEQVTQRWHLPEEIALEIPAELRQAGIQASAASEGVLDQPLVAGITEEEIELRCQEAYERGREEALALAVMESNERLGQAEQRIQATLQDMEQQITEVITGLEHQALELSVEIAKKIIDTAVEIDPGYIAELIKEALSLVDEKKVFKIRISPEDYKFVHFIGLENRIRSQGCSWEFVSDDTVRSGCVLESDSGDADFQLDNAWALIKDKVLQLIP